LLTLAIHQATVPGAESALFAKKFFDRTTRWMSSKEREWFTAVCYLDKINEDTLRAVFREEDVPLVQDWFEREASIRDPASRLFQMRPLIREKVLRYLETRSPSRHREMLQKVKRFERDDTSS
jgi:DICT domain-containing protein